MSGTQFAKFQIIGANRARKCARSLFNCISVTNGIKINEQKNPIAKRYITRLFYNVIKLTDREFSRKLSHIIIIMSLRLSYYNFRAVKPIDFLFSNFILHHFSMVKYILRSCMCSVPVSEDIMSPWKKCPPGQYTLGYIVPRTIYLRIYCPPPPPPPLDILSPSPDTIT